MALHQAVRHAVVLLYLRKRAHRFGGTPCCHGAAHMVQWSNCLQLLLTECVEEASLGSGIQQVSRAFHGKPTGDETMGKLILQGVRYTKNTNKHSSCGSKPQPTGDRNNELLTER